LNGTGSCQNRTGFTRNRKFPPRGGLCFPEPVYDIDELAGKLAGTGANTGTNPYTVVFSAAIEEDDNLSDKWGNKIIDIINSDWSVINTAIKNSGRYIILDISECTATGTIKGAASTAGNNFNIIKDNIYIKSVILPGALTGIGDYAFYGCASLATVYVLSESVPAPGNSAFYDCSVLTSIYVPGSKVDEYKSAFGWSGCADRIFAIPEE